MYRISFIRSIRGYACRDATDYDFAGFLANLKAGYPVWPDTGYPAIFFPLAIYFLRNLPVGTSVVDPNTLNFDPDPLFWPNLDPDPGLLYQF